MLNPVNIAAIIDILASVGKLFKGDRLCKILSGLALVGVIIIYIKYEYLEKRIDALNDYDRTTRDNQINLMIAEMLRDCGELSYGSWILVKYSEGLPYEIQFKDVQGCDYERSKSNNCAIDISSDNEIYKMHHRIYSRTARFIQDNPLLPNQTVFEDLVPVCFNLRDKDESSYLTYEAPEVWSIIRSLKLGIDSICGLKVRVTSEKDSQVVSIFTLSFANGAEHSCGVDKNGKQEGDYLRKLGVFYKRNYTVVAH